MIEQLKNAPQDPDIAARNASARAQEQYISWRQACLKQLGDQEMVLVSPTNFESYAGVVLLGIAGKKLWLGVEDLGWDMESMGEQDDDGNITREAEGEDTLDYKLIDLSKTYYNHCSVSIRIPEDQIHGIAYAVTRAIEFGDDYHRYRQYVIRELLAMGAITDQNIPQEQTV